MKHSLTWIVLACCGALGAGAAVWLGLSLEPPADDPAGGADGPGPSIVAMASPRPVGTRLAARRQAIEPPALPDRSLVEPIVEPAHPPRTSQVAPEPRDSVTSGAVLKALEQFAQAAAAGRPDGQTPSAAPPADAPGDARGLPPAEQLPAGRDPVPRIERIRGNGEGDNQLVIHIQDEDLRQVLALLSEQGGLNILAGPSVQGKVSATLNGVSVEAALEAILKSTGFIARRDGPFIYVGTSQEFEVMRQSLDRIGTRIYRPNFVTARDLQTLIAPLLTTASGKISVTAPAEVGIATDTTNAGGDSMAGGEAVLVQDYEDVLAHIDQVVQEIDRRPAQVSIEAMILSVKLNDQNQFGVDFQLLRDKSNVRFGLGSPRINPLEGGGQINPVTGGTIGEFDFDGGGMRFAFLDDSLGAFLTALETIGDTNVIATPRLMCLNKQRAEILIGAQLGYISTTLTSTSTSQNVNFLEVGAQLRIRPFISSDGLIRMEVHPELSTGSVRVEQGFTLPDKEVTQVTTNIMVRDGCTVIIGGLMREDLSTSTSQIPLVGSLPIVGALFRNKTEKIDRREILVLITPRIVGEPATCVEGAEQAHAFLARQAVVADAMTPLGKRYLGRKNLRKAQQAAAAGDRASAIRLAELAVHFDPLNLEAVEFSRSLTVRGGGKPEVVVEGPIDAADHPLDGETIPPWVLDQLEADGGNSIEHPGSMPRELAPPAGPRASGPRRPAVPIQRPGAPDANR
jgi:type IV pilus assembly protein PilQ